VIREFIVVLMTTAKPSINEMNASSSRWSYKWKTIIKRGWAWGLGRSR